MEIVDLIRNGVKTFEPNCPTCLVTDWSKSGIGFNLTQKHCRCSDPANPGCGEGHWKLVFARPRFTTDTDNRYAPIEGEAFAVRLWVATMPHVHYGFTESKSSCRPQTVDKDIQ